MYDYGWLCIFDFFIVFMVCCYLVLIDMILCVEDVFGFIVGIWCLWVDEVGVVMVEVGEEGFELDIIFDVFVFLVLYVGGVWVVVFYGVGCIDVFLVFVVVFDCVFVVFFVLLLDIWY